MLCGVLIHRHDWCGPRIWGAPPRRELTRQRALVGLAARRSQVEDPLDRVVRYSCVPTSPDPHWLCRIHRQRLRQGRAIMPRSGIRTTVIDADNQVVVAPQREADTDGLLRANESASSATVSVQLLEQCSPIRTRCPEPAAKWLRARRRPLDADLPPRAPVSFAEGKNRGSVLASQSLLIEVNETPHSAGASRRGGWHQP